jgi:hypothetical protein
MNPFALLDNPLFLQNWRERMRPALVVSALIVTGFVIFLIFSGAYVQKSVTSSGADPHLDVFLWLAYAQGVALLLVGSMSANNMAARERIAGTLDFHRSSPTPRLTQILGILFGATSLEWTMVLATLPISLTLSLITNIGIMMAITFYIQLFICAVFFHLGAIFMGIQAYGDAQAATRRENPLKIFIIFYFFSQIFFLPLATHQASFVYHMSWLPAYSELKEHIHPASAASYRWPDAETTNLLFTFYGTKLSAFCYQILVQIPFILFLWSAITRKISFPGRPVLTKIQALSLIGFFVFLFLGSSLSVLWNPPLKHALRPNDHLLAYLYFVLFLGMFTLFSQTPNRLSYLKGLRRAQRLGIKKLGRYDDQTSNIYFLIMFTVIVLAGALGFSAWIDFLEFKNLSFLLLILLQIAFFAGTWEYFSLSPNYSKKSLFVVILSIPWLFLPLFSVITSPALKSSFSLLKSIFCSLSPFFSLAVLSDLLKNKSDLPQAYLIIIINILATVLVLFAASNLRRTIKQQPLQ